MKSTFTFFRTALVLIVLFFLHPINNSAQVLTGKTGVSIVSNSGGFWEYLPVNYSAPGNTQTYPLIIFGQGLGELGNGTTELVNLLNVGLPHVIASGAFPATFTVNGQTFSFIVIAPQYYNAPSIPDLQNVINYAVANYRVDVNRIYMTGLSNGGGKCWEYASNQIGYANRLAAIVPICGSYYANDAGSRIIASSNLPVWATHNDGDPIWPVASTIGWIDLINRAPYPVPLAKKTIFLNNNSHDAWTQTYDPNFRENGLNIYEWMLQYKRNYVGTNQPPIANAGGNVNLALPNNSTLLYATNSWDPDGSIASYNWSYRSGPSQYSINSTTSSTPFISNLALGRYVFGLTVTDNGGATTSDSVIINVYPEIKPIPGRIEAETYNAMSGVQKENTTDSGGAQNVGFIDNGDWMDYTVNAAAAGPYTVNFRVAAQNAGAQFQLRQSNGTVLATMNVPQTGDWQTWTTITTTVTLPAGVQTLRVLANSVPSWTFNWFEFIAVDRSPTANAGPFQTIIVPASQVTLTGSATPNNGGTIASYAWSQVSGTAATITNPSSASTTVTGLTTLGARVFRLTATDNEGRTGTDDVTITVNNPGPPSASAGAAQIIQLPTAQVILTGSGTANNGGTIRYAWTQVSGTTATIATPSSAITTVTGLSTAGVRVFRLTVTDNGGSTATSDVTVTVNPVSLSTPYGGNRRIIPGKLEAEEFDNGGQNIAYYDGTTANTGGAFRQTESVDIRTCPDVGAGYAVGWTTDGEWLKFSVTVTTTGIYSFSVRAGTPNTGKSVQLQVDGATVGTLTVTNSGGYDTWATSTLNNVLLIAGDHTFRFLFNTGDAVNTSQGFDMNWFNFALVTDLSPVANAGNAQSIFLPTSQVTLTGSGTANNGGSIVSYTWTQVSGAADASITSPSSASTSVTGLSQGVYVFRLTVTDNQGATAGNNVTITVNPVPGFVTITASNPQTIAVSTASLTSVSSGTIGTPTTKWTKFSVPGQTIKKLTVIGSSTAAGNGATAIDSAFVNRLKTFYTAQGIITTVTNLAVAGQSPWDLTANNAALLTAALNTNPDVMLMAYPSEAYPLQTIPAIMAKFQQIADSCTARGVKLYISGTQPRGDYSVSDRQKLVTINDSLRLRFTTRFIDFLTPLNNTTDNTIKPQYNSGDGIQLNNAGHTVIAEVVKAASIFQNTILSASVIASPTSANTSITGLVTGVHQFQVSVVDNLGFAATAIATITTNIPIPPPTANAGIAQTIALPLTTITLAGSGTPNNGGTIASYAWTQVSGTAATITNPSSATTTVTGLTTLGVRVFRLTVTDNQGYGTSDVIITVNPLSDGKTIPGKIEAEVWDTKSGYQ